MTIWKYPLILNGTKTRTQLSLPHGAEVLCAQLQEETICLWVTVEPVNSCELRKFVIYGTGWDCAPLQTDKYIGTVQAGCFVWHVFEDTAGATS